MNISFCINKKSNTHTAPQELLYLLCFIPHFTPDHNEGSPLTTVDQRNNVLYLQAPIPGSHPPVCNPSVELEHQRLASDHGVQ